MSNTSRKQKLRAKTNLSQVEIEETPIGDLIERYLQNTKATARSKATYASYRASLKVFTFWLEEEMEGLQTPISAFTSQESLNGYYIYLDEVRGNKQTSIVTHKRQLRTFLYWLMDNHLMPEFNIKITAAQEEVLKFYTDEELMKLTVKPGTNASFVEWRNYLIVLLILATGNRRSTIVAYKIGDFDFVSNTITMNRTKAKIGQQIPMHPSLKRQMRKYIKMFRSEASNEEPMFPNEFGEELKPISLSRSIAAYNTNRGVKPTSIHMYRHTFARNWVRNGGDSLQLQRILGHATLAMTEKYVRLFRDDLVDAVTQFASINAVPNVQEQVVRSKIRKRGTKSGSA